MRHFAYCRADGVTQQIVSIGESGVTPPAIAGLTVVEIDRPQFGYALQGGVFVPSAPSDADLAQAARVARDRLLDVTDRTQLGDAPFSVAQVLAWRAFRTTLRNVPQQAGFPRTINWPNTPDGVDTTPPPAIIPSGAAPSVIVAAPPSVPPVFPLPPPPP